MDQKLNFYYTIGDVFEYIKETEPKLGFDDDILNPNPERIKLDLQKELYSYYTFVHLVKKLLLNLIIS